MLTLRFHQLSVFILRVTFLLCLWFNANPVLAKEVSEARARLVASNAWKQFYEGKTDRLLQDPSFNEPICIKDGTSKALYIFNEAGGNGFVIVAADDRVTPLLGFSFSGKYSNGDQPPAFSWFMSSLLSQMHTVLTEDIKAPVSVNSEWIRFTQTPWPLNKSVSSTGPLLTTSWDQGCYYNDSCPAATSSYRCYHVPTGCVATAMAQVLRYWKFPPYGLESHSYNHSTYGILSANFSDARYEYDNMPGQVTSTNPYVAQLMYHCGVAVNMVYGPGSSAAEMASVDGALRNYFGFSSAAHWQMRNYTDSAQWGAMLRAELDLGRPLVYYGVGDQEPHLFVCDGYRADNYFHFNWGWSSNYDGYYYVNSLNPAFYDFSNIQAAIFDLFPVSVPTILWDSVGVPAFTPTRTYLGGLQVNSAGIPFIACRPLSADSVLVYKFNGVSWALVGKPLPAPGSSSCRLQFDRQDFPYVLFYDQNSKPTILRFNGSSWVAAGDPLPVTYGQQADMVFDKQNSLYVSLMFYDQGVTYGYVYKQENGSWTKLGNAPFSTAQNLPQLAKIAVDTNDHVYVLYSDGADGFKAKVAEFDGASWSLAGNGNVGSMGTVYSNAITVGDGNKVYACLSDQSVCRIYRYDRPGWTQIGGGEQGFPASDPDLVADTRGNLYFGFVDLQQATRGSVMKFREGEWTSMGPTGFTPGTATSSRIALSSDGTIYYAFEDLCLDNRITVQKHRDPSYGIISHTTQTPGWTLSPNPCSGSTINISGPPAKTMNYTLTDLPGRLFSSGIINNPSSLEGRTISSLPSTKGMYLVTITTENGSSSMKLIIQ